MMDFMKLLQNSITNQMALNLFTRDRHIFPHIPSTYHSPLSSPLHLFIFLLSFFSYEDFLVALHLLPLLPSPPVSSTSYFHLPPPCLLSLSFSLRLPGRHTFIHHHHHQLLPLSSTSSSLPPSQSTKRSEEKAAPGRPIVRGSACETMCGRPHTQCRQSQRGHRQRKEGRRRVDYELKERVKERGKG